MFSHDAFRENDDMMLWVMIIRMIINSTYFSVLIWSSLLDFGEPFSSTSFSVIFSIDNLQERARIRKNTEAAERVGVETVFVSGVHEGCVLRSDTPQSFTTSLCSTIQAIQHSFILFSCKLKGVDFPNSRFLSTLKHSRL